MSFLSYINAQVCTIALKFPCDLQEEVRFVINFLLNTLNSFQVSNLLKKKGADCKSLRFFRVLFSAIISYE